MSNNSEIMTILQQVFPIEDGFKIKNEGLNAFSIRTGKARCLLFVFKEPQLYINFLSKCDINGTESLRRIEEVAKYIPYITSIGLTDGSGIEVCDCVFDLAMLKIITKGESWYNSLGYVSENYEIEKSYNELFIGLSCVEFIEELRKKEINNLMKLHSRESIIENIKRLENKKSSVFIKLKNKYISNLENYKDFIGMRIEEIENSINKFNSKIYYFEDPTSPICTEVNKLWKTIVEKKECDIPKCEWLSEFLEYIFDSGILMYNQKLSKTIEK